QGGKRWQTRLHCSRLQHWVVSQSLAISSSLVEGTGIVAKFVAYSNYLFPQNNIAYTANRFKKYSGRPQQVSRPPILLGRHYISCVAHSNQSWLLARGAAYLRIFL